MLEIDFWYKKKFGNLACSSISFPENWEEASESFVTCFAKHLLFSNSNSNTNVIDFILEYCEADKKLQEKLTRGFLEQELLPRLSFLGKISSASVFLKEISFPDGSVWAGPSDYLFTMTVAQFILSDATAREYSKTKDEKHLNRLVAILYQDAPVGINFRFDAAMVQSRSVAAHEITIEVKKTVYLNYVAMLSWFKENGKYAFAFGNNETIQSAETEDPEFDQDRQIIKQKEVSGDWSALIFAMAGDKLGTVDDVEALPFIYFLDRVLEVNKKAA